MAPVPDNKIAIVTGGGSGIGEALCRELGRRDAHVIVADIDGDNAARVAGDIVGSGGHAAASTVDVAKEQDVWRLIEETVAAHGRLDYLFNNAGIGLAGDVRDLTLDHWRRVIDVDLYGVLHGVQAAYPVMVRQGFGHIVNTSSAAAFVPDPGNAPYATAKHAVVGLSLALRLEGADLGVKVSCVCPGFVESNIYRKDLLVNMDVPEDVTMEQMLGAPSKMVSAPRAAQIILEGVARDQAVIVFPGSMRWALRIYRLFPRFIEKYLLKQMREWRRYRVEGPADEKPDAVGQSANEEQASPGEQD